MSQLKTTTDHFDYVIIGGGSAGCVVTRRLIEGTDATVLLLEAGGSDEGVATIADASRWLENLGSPYDWAYTYEPGAGVDNRRLPAPRGKVLGGSGSINAMTWLRGDRGVYNGWARIGNRGWDYNSVLPLFKKSEDWEGGASEFRGAGGPIQVQRMEPHPVATALVEACRDYGMPYLHDVNGPRCEGVGLSNLNVRTINRSDPAEAYRRSGPADAYLRPVISHPRLTVRTGAQAVKLRLHGTHCTGVDVLLKGELRSIGASKEVILCAGAFDSPRLLMLSGIGPQAELRRLGITPVVDLPGVGENLQDHAFIASLCFEAKHPVLAFKHKLTAAAAFWKSRPDISIPDLMFIARQVPLLSDELRAQYRISGNVFAISPALVQVQSRGYVRMKTARHDGPLEIQPNLLKEPADVDALATGVELGLHLASLPAYRDLIKRPVAPTGKLTRDQTVAFLRRASINYYHPVGTCAMGTGDHAVVDPRLRVRGVERLRVADASIMPTITSTNTHAAVIMIGEFASQLLVAG